MTGAQVTYKISVFSLLVLLVTYFFYAFLLLPQWIRRDELTAQHKIEREQVQRIENFVLAHPNAEQHLIELDSKIVQVDMILPDHLDLSYFLLEIEELSRECGVQIGYLKHGKMTNKEGYREIDVELLIKGNFLQSMSFLRKVENGLRFINVTSIGMKIEKNVLESELKAKIYSYGVVAAGATPNEKNTGSKK